MATLQDLMHDLSSEHNKLILGSVVVREDLELLIKEGHIKATQSELTETISYTESVLTRVGQYVITAFGIIILVKPFIDERVGPSNEIFSTKSWYDKISDVAGGSLDILKKDDLKKLPEPQLVAIIEKIRENFNIIVEYAKEAEKIVVKVKPLFYEKIGPKTEVSLK